MIAMESQLITVREAARLRAVSRQSVYDLIARGKLATIRQHGRILLRRADVERFEPAPAGRPRGKAQKQ